MPAFTSIALGIGAAASVGGAVSGAIQQGDAMDQNERLARDQMAQNDRLAQQQLEESRAIRAQALQYAQATPQELQQMSVMTQQANNTYQQQLAALEQDKQILASVDPAIRAAGEETLKLIQGEESRILAPLQRQRQLQREQLKSNLRQQLGSGYETSQAGFMALQQFDQQSNDMTLNAQQSTINSMLGLTSQAMASRTNISGRVGEAGQQLQNSLSNVLQGTQNIQNRVTNAAGGQPNYNGVMQANAQNNQLLGNIMAQNMQNPTGNAIAGVANAAGSLGSILYNQNYQQQQLEMINNLTNRGTGNISTSGNTLGNTVIPDWRTQTV